MAASVSEPWKPFFLSDAVTFSDRKYIIRGGISLKNPKYQVFISYRRETGENLAQLLYYKISGDGYSTFLDVKKMHSGKFNEQIYNAIDECDDFILVLSENALDRCSESNDWLRLEIEYAFKTNKNIILVFGRNFRFPDSIPLSIKQIKDYEGVTANSEFFDATIEKIEKLMESIPANSYKVDPQSIQSLPVLLTDMYYSLVEFRKATYNSDIQEINRITGVLQNNAQFIFLFYEYNKYSDKIKAEKANKVVQLYNSFIYNYGKFISFAPGKSRMSIEAHEYARKAESIFNSLIDIILQYKAEESEE